jgi:hypothetical protein
MTGGVFVNSARIRQIFSNVIRTDRPEVGVRLGEREPYMGALYLAKKALENSESSLREPAVIKNRY